MTGQLLYLYAFVPAGIDTIEAEGLDQAPVRVIEADGVAMAVSSAPAGRLRAQRRHLAAHQGVVKILAERGPTLPASFGLVATEAELVSMTRANATTLLEELGRVGGSVEYAVRLRFDGGEPFARLVAMDDELRALRDELVDLGDAAPHDLRVAVGRRVESVLGHLRSAFGDTIGEAVREHSKDVQIGDPRDDAEIVNISCLVERGQEDAFITSLTDAAEGIDDEYEIEIVGPFAPHSFVRINLAAATEEFTRTAA